MSNPPRPIALEVPARRIPVSSTVSPELQEAMSRTCLGLPDPEISAASYLSKGGDEVEQIARIDALRRSLDAHSETRIINGVTCFVVAPREVPDQNRDRLIINFHGGGYVLGGGEGGTVEAVLLASAAQMTTIAVDYRMPPAYPFPAAMDDAFAVWSELASSHAPSRIAVSGTSSGGGMALALVQRMLSEGLPTPGAVVAGTPWADLTKTGDSYFIQDIGLGTYDGPLEQMALAYANGVDLKDPRLSPVYGRFSGFPPTMLTSGTRDLFLSNTVRVAQALREADAEVYLQVLEGEAHATYLNPAFPESRFVFGEVAKFLRRHI